MDQRQPKRSIADDPNFLASLEELDHGLSGGTEPEARVQPFPPRPAAAPLPPLARVPPAGLAPPAAHAPPLISIAAPPPPLAAHASPTPSAITLPAPPPWLPPTAFAAVSAASAALSAAFDAPATSAPAATPPPALAGAARSPRTLLDLFPPAASRDSTAPSLAMRDPAVPPPIAAVEPPRVAVVRRVTPAAPSAPTYETFYGLSETPFAPEPDPRFLYHSTAHDRALQDLAAAIGRDAAVTLTGRAGLGKTMVCRALIDQLDRRTLVSVPSGALRSGDDLLKTLLVDFGVISQADVTGGRLASASHDSLTGALRDFLSSLSMLQASALLILDDAHALPGDVLRELRALVDIAASGTLLQIVLVGEPELTRLLRGGDLGAIDERVGLRLELGPLEPDEVAGYVAHRLAVAGRGERVDFDDAALRRIFNRSSGVPGVVNRICDRAMRLGYQSSASRIGVEFVEEASQQLGIGPGDAAASWRDRALVAALMLSLMGVGAAAAGWVYREPLARIWLSWHR